MTEPKFTPDIHFVGPAAQHNVTCWVCKDNPAVYDMYPNWCFRPCWNCQRWVNSGWPWWKRRLLEHLGVL